MPSQSDSDSHILQITSGPTGIVESRDAIFNFVGIGVNTFECQINQNGFVPCTSPVSYSNLQDGVQTFSVRGFTSRGVIAEVSHTWTSVGQIATIARSNASGYDCNLPSNAQINVGNIGYSFLQDEIAYSNALLLAQKNCFQNRPKTVMFYVGTVNFPVDGVAFGVGSGDEQRWLDYWERQILRYTDLGYEIWIHPMPFILSPGGILNELKPGLRWLTKNDLDLTNGQMPTPYECRDGRRTVIASIYDPRTIELGRRFYSGINTFFSPYSSVTKISIVPPSDFGEYGFPFGVPAGWWLGSDTVNDCYKTGDSYARQLIASDPPTAELYSGRINEFRASLTQIVKGIFPNKRYMVYLGYGNDINPVDGFTYAEVVQWAAANGVEVHSSHLCGGSWAISALDKIKYSMSSGQHLSMEGCTFFGEYEALKNVYFAEYMRANTLLIYHLFDSLMVPNLHFSAGVPPASSLVNTKSLHFNDAQGLGAIRSTHLSQGFIDAPTANAQLSGESPALVGGWGFFNPPYGDQQNYGVQVYAGQLFEGAGFSSEVNERSVSGLRPQFMRRVASVITDSPRAVGLNDRSRFGTSWTPNFSSGKAVLRFYFVNGASEIIAEHPQSPIVVNIAGRVSGHYYLRKTNTDFCSLNLQVHGTAQDSQALGQPLPLAVIDEYRGRVLATGTTDANGSFSIDFSIDSASRPIQVSPRVYAILENSDGSKRLISLMWEVSSPLAHPAGYNILSNGFLTLMGDCD